MRVLLRTVLPLLLLATARGQLLEWRAAIAANSSAKATFTAIQARPDTGPANPDRAFTCGHFEGSFAFGPPPGLPNATGSDGVVVRLSEGPPWDIDWKAQAESTAGDVELHDLSIAPGGDIYVCGTFTGDIQFTGSAFNFTNPGGPHGFVAWLNPDSGTWLGAYATPGIQPASLVALASGNVVLTGPGTLAARYSATGTQLWSTAVPPGTTGWAHIATDPPSVHAYVMTRRPDPSSNDVSLARLLLSNGNVLWSKSMGSPGPDTTGGLDVAPDGDVRLTFAADHPAPRYDGILIPGVPPVAAIHTVMGRMRPDGSPRWLVPVGLAQGPGALTSADLDCDAFGNAWLAARFDGPWKIESRIEAGDDDAALIAVDGTGLLFDFHRSTGAASEKPLGVAAPVKTLALLAGEYLGNGSTFPNRPPFPNRANPEAFVTVASPVAVQNHYVFRPAGANPPTPQQLVDILDQAGLQVYAIAQNSTTGLCVSAHATPGQINDLASNPNLAFELEAGLAANGTNTDAGWALGRLNDPAASATTANNTFTYPDTGGEVVVYLIDTAVDELAGWFAGNANLAIEDSTLIRGAGDPTESSSFEHGTQVLSMLAGPSCGPAVGSPVRLVNFDIYPSGSTSYTTLLNDAILEAIDHHAANHPCSPALICIASSSSAPATSATVSAALSIALADGIPLVLSAGNLAANAANYVPQRYAAAGILCVGASGTANTRSTISNFGTPVDLFAPGSSVRAVDFANPTGTYDSFDGTSASAALVAGVAAVHLSVNPWQTPDELESAVLADVFGALPLAQLPAPGPTFTGSFADWAAWHDLAATDTAADSDGDGITDGMEFVLGGDPCTDDNLSPLDFSFDGTTAELSFTVSAVLHDPATPGVLRDGTTWEIESSTDLSAWSRAAGTFGFGSAAWSRIPVTLTDTPVDPACFFRLDISHAP